MKQIGVKNVKLTEYEMSIAAHLVDPLSMHVRKCFPFYSYKSTSDMEDTSLLCYLDDIWHIYVSMEIHRKYFCSLKLR